jgi:hypothetical protein
MGNKTLSFHHTVLCTICPEMKNIHVHDHDVVYCDHIYSYAPKAWSGRFIYTVCNLNNCERKFDQILVSKPGDVYNSLPTNVDPEIILHTERVWCTCGNSHIYIKRQKTNDYNFGTLNELKNMLPNYCTEHSYNFVKKLKNIVPNPCLWDNVSDKVLNHPIFFWNSILIS